MRTVREIADHRPLLERFRFLMKRVVKTAVAECLTEPIQRQMGVVVLPLGYNHRVTERAYEVQPTAGHLHTAQQVACDHGVTFDQVAAAPMTVAEVRAKYPRLDGLCPKGCGFHGIAYKSTAHFVYGDW